MERDHEICKRFIDKPNINPVTNGRLEAYKTPYNGYIRLCEKLGYNVDHLKNQIIIPEVKELPEINDKNLWNWVVGEGEIPIKIDYPVIRKYQLNDIKQWRQTIRELSGIAVNLESFNDLELYHLYDLYNKYFFNSALPKIAMTISTSLTKTAGKCRTTRDGKSKCEYSIIISKPVFARLNLKEQQSTKSGGVECQSRLECLQLVLEHEMIHLAIQIYVPNAHAKDQKIYSSHGSLFKELVYAYFGQTTTTHQIGNIILTDEKEEQVTKNTAKIGTMVSFLNKNLLRKGVISDVHPINAIVLFLNGDNLKLNYEFLNKVGKNDEDYPALLQLKTELNDKLSYLNRLNIGDKVRYEERGKIVDGIVSKTYPRSNAVAIKSGNAAYKVHYSYLIVPIQKVDLNNIITMPVTEVPKINLDNRPIIKPVIVNKKDQFRVGDKVKADNGKKVIIGTITKKNPVNAVILDENKVSWSINYNILTFA